MWAPPVTTVGPAAEPLELAAVKEFVRVEADNDSFDLELGGYVAGVASDVEAISGTRLITQTVELRADAFADLAFLPIGPVQSVTALTYLDVAGDEQTIDPADYELFGAGLAQGIRPAFGASWPIPANRAGAITVTAVVGYGDSGEDVPQDIAIAMLRAVRGLFDDKPIELEQLLVNRRIWL